MNAYRNESENKVSSVESPVYDEDAIVAWVWLVAGALLILTDIGQPWPWGAWSSLGMLMTGGAIIALGRHYAAKWKWYMAARRSARHVREV